VRVNRGIWSVIGQVIAFAAVVVNLLLCLSSLWLVARVVVNTSIRIMEVKNDKIVGRSMGHNDFRRKTD
jgi:hypothetical protein